MLDSTPHPDTYLMQMNSVFPATQSYSGFPKHTMHSHPHPSWKTLIHPSSPRSNKEHPVCLPGNVFLFSWLVTLCFNVSQCGHLFNCWLFFLSMNASMSETVFVPHFPWYLGVYLTYSRCPVNVWKRTQWNVWKVLICEWASYFIQGLLVKPSFCIYLLLYNKTPQCTAV